MSISVPSEIIGQLREDVVGLKKSDIYTENVEPKEAVLARFQPVFASEHARFISSEEFKSFLIFENNLHWTGLHRQSSRICSNMEALRAALVILPDETRPVNERLDEVTDMVYGMGKNIATAILTVLFPGLYGVWNNRSEGGIKKLDIWPTFEKGESFGNRYVKVNEILLQLRDALQIDLWELDALWWYRDKKEIDQKIGDTSDIANITEIPDNQQCFGLERHLHEFMRDNWERIELGSEWQIYSEPGDREAGYEYPCKVGRIDLLAKHKTLPKWLVIELKRNQTSDQTVGQLLRYMGWVKKHLIEKEDQVHGMIICRQPDETLSYAISMINDVKMYCYEVDFRLKPFQSTTKA